jgi:hypothetical protein
MIISINSGSWQEVMFIRLVINFGELIKVAQRKGQDKGWVVREVWRLLGFGPLCVFGCLYGVVVESACVRDFRGLGLCRVGTVG